jgi:hypothetical protein
MGGDLLNCFVPHHLYMTKEKGEPHSNNIHGQKGDGIAISDETTVPLKAKTDAELLIIEVPGMNDAR